MWNIFKQIKLRRKDLGLTQQDMYMRTGLTQQQYQRIEKGSNPTLNSLEAIAVGLDAEIMLIPKEKKQAVIDLLLETHTLEIKEHNPSSGIWQKLLSDIDND